MLLQVVVLVVSIMYSIGLVLKFIEQSFIERKSIDFVYIHYRIIIIYTNMFRYITLFSNKHQDEIFIENDGEDDRYEHQKINQGYHLHQATWNIIMC